MEIERCNSIFELFAAFNFTYAIISSSTNENTSEGNSFVDIVDRNVMKSFSLYISDTKQKFTSRITYIKESVETLSERQELKGNLALKQEVYSISKQANKLTIKVLRWVGDISDQKKASQLIINERFPRISLVLGLFCIAVLLLSTSQSSHRHLTLALIDIVTILVLRKYFVVRNTTVNLIPMSYLRLLFSFSLGVIIVLLLHLFVKFYLVDEYYAAYKSFVVNFDKHEFFRPCVVILTMMLPLSHFTFFFILFAISLKRIENVAKKNLVYISANLDELEEENANLLNANPPTID